MRPRRSIPQAALDLAVVAGLREAEAVFGVPRSTLARRLRDLNGHWPERRDCDASDWTTGAPRTTNRGGPTVTGHPHRATPKHKSRPIRLPEGRKAAGPVVVRVGVEVVEVRPAYTRRELQAIRAAARDPQPDDVADDDLTAAERAHWNLTRDPDRPDVRATHAETHSGDPFTTLDLNEDPPGD